MMSKLYAKTEQDTDSVIHITRIYRKEVVMSLGLDKCSWVTST